MSAARPTIAELTAAHPEWQRPEDLPLRLTIPMVAVLTQRHYLTIQRAMVSGELRATQRSRGGTWSTRIEHVMRWLDGEPPLPRGAVRPARRTA